MNTIKRGESKLFDRSLLQADGVTPLLVSSATAIKLELLQASTVKKTLVKGTDAGLRQSDDSPSAVTVELSETDTAALAKGTLSERWTITVADADFDTNSGKQTSVLVLNVITIT